jgi:hypothetical protein
LATTALVWVPPVEKDFELVLAQPSRQRLHLRMISPVVAQKDIDGFRRHM